MKKYTLQELKALYKTYSEAQGIGEWQQEYWVELFFKWLEEKDLEYYIQE